MTIWTAGIPGQALPILLQKSRGPHHHSGACRLETYTSPARDVRLRCLHAHFLPTSFGCMVRRSISYFDVTEYTHNRREHYGLAAVAANRR